jgi:hypothetical protein
MEVVLLHQVRLLLRLGFTRTSLVNRIYEANLATKSPYRRRCIGNHPVLFRIPEGVSTFAPSHLQYTNAEEVPLPFNLHSPRNFCRWIYLVHH